MIDIQVQDQIRVEFEGCITRTLERLEQEDTLRPFHAALLTPEAVAWSRLERSFSTSFGQSVVEKISRLVCLGAGADDARNQHETQVTLTTTQWDEATRIVREARTAGSGYVPRWDRDLDRMVSAGAFGVPDTRRVISDLWWKRDGIEHFLSIKTVKPNIDQTAQAKLDLLHLAAEDSKREVYFGLYYNPFGEEQSEYAWSPAARLFDLANDHPVLIGREYWDVLGGPGTYITLLETAAEAGHTTRSRVLEYGARVIASNSQAIEGD
ncbi:TdeIII family type II restriction endonuclease [Agromyces laixinhei]|uniref:TdeIII family type II restriction endonuclease n=1 Tax=Agromyces laixinhei TaxID=2585717 RepID=UPI0018DC178D|nr:TdeIII family type II restriction endonuclease [Agromyces laixinhei]